MSFPAISGAEPWLGSYKPNLLSFKDADAAKELYNRIQANFAKQDS